MAELPDSVREAFEDTNFWHLATVNPDGSPQTTPVWVSTRDGKILVNTALGRKKPRNIENDPRVALSWHGTDENGAYRNIQVQGRVVDTITGDQAEQDIDSLALKYIGEETYPWRREGEQRVTYLIEPLRILGG
jgi:PPOX class probable F420-dependent enzyme